MAIARCLRADRASTPKTSTTSASGSAIRQGAARMAARKTHAPACRASSQCAQSGRPHSPMTALTSGEPESFNGTSQM